MVFRIAARGVEPVKGPHERRLPCFMVLQSEPVLAVQSPSLPCFMVLQSDLNLVADGAVENQNSH